MINLHTNYPLLLSDVNETWILLHISKYPQIQEFINIRPVRPKLFHAGRRTDKHDEANCCFAHFLNALEDDKENRVSTKWGKVHV
jgi:hypothetical protein